MGREENDDFVLMSEVPRFKEDVMTLSELHPSEFNGGKRPKGV